MIEDQDSGEYDQNSDITISENLEDSVNYDCEEDEIDDSYFQCQ